jgi:hypothetical protein
MSVRNNSAAEELIPTVGTGTFLLTTQDLDNHRCTKNLSCRRKSKGLPSPLLESSECT